MLEDHLNQLCDIYEVSRDDDTRNKEETKVEIETGVNTLKLQKNLSSTDENRTLLTTVLKTAFLFKGEEVNIKKGNYILLDSVFYEIENVESFSAFSGSSQFRAICTKKS